MNYLCLKQKLQEKFAHKSCVTHVQFCFILSKFWQQFADFIPSKKRKEIKFKNVQFITIYVVKFGGKFPICLSRHQNLEKSPKIAISQAVYFVKLTEING